MFSPGRVLLYVFLVSYCLTSVGAFLWIASISLKSNPEFFATSPWSVPKSPSLDNYREAWTTAKIGTFVLNSALVTVGERRRDAGRLLDGGLRALARAVPRLRTR